MVQTLPKQMISLVKSLLTMFILVGIKGVSERFGDRAFLDSSVTTDRVNTCVFWFDKTIFFTIRTQRLLLKLSKAAQSQFCCTSPIDFAACSPPQQNCQMIADTEA